MLPDFELTPYYKLKLPILGKEVSFRPYCIGEELTFLTHIETENKNDFVNSLNTLLKNCIKEKELFDELTVIDFVYLLVNIRGKSKGEIIEVEKKCSKCDFTQPFSFDMIKSLKINNQKNLKAYVDISDDIKLEIGIPNVQSVFSIDNENEHELKLMSIANSIKKIVIKEEIHNKLDPKDVLEKFVKKCTDQQLLKLVESINKLVSLKFVIPCSCSKCKHQEDIEVDNIISFLL